MAKSKGATMLPVEVNTALGTTLLAVLEADPKINTEPPPWLATNRRSFTVSIRIRRGEEIWVAEPLMVASGATLPLAVKAVPKRRIEPAVATKSFPPEVPPVLTAPRRGETTQPKVKSSIKNEAIKERRT